MKEEIINGGFDGRVLDADNLFPPPPPIVPIPIGTIKTALCLSGKLSSIEHYDNIFRNVIEPYNADVFIDSWIPFNKHTMKSCAISEEMRHFSTVLPEEIPANINQYCEVFQPKLINLEYFDAMPLTLQVRSVLPAKVICYNKQESPGTLKENVLFMFYKIWKCNQLRKFYEQINRIRYDRIIRMRFDTTFDLLPVIEPKVKSVYIPNAADHCGGWCDQFAIADSQTMDIYCELYNEIYRYLVAGIGIHPESILRKHLEVNRLNVERFDCVMYLRGVRQ